MNSSFITWRPAPCNTCFKKSDYHLIKDMSGNKATLIDFVLFGMKLCKLVTHMKVILGEEAALQPQLLV